MATVSTNIRIDEGIKARASELFEGLGMTLSEAVNVFLRQSLLHCGLPFKVEYPEEKPNWATRRAMKEAEKIAKHPERYKTYKNVDELFEEMRKW